MKTAVAILVTIGLLFAMPISGLANNHSTRYFFGFNLGVGVPPYYGPPGWGPLPYWGPRPYWGPPAVLVAPPYPYPAPPVVVVPQQPQVYVQRNQQGSDYWHYCQNPQGYYPYVKSCPGGWMKVVPETIPPGR
jgi:hypothetical protein